MRRRSRGGWMSWMGVKDHLCVGGMGMMTLVRGRGQSGL